MATKSIHIENLSHQYMGVDAKALKNLSLSIEEGDIFGLLGPNGAGKTTLISILTGLIPLQEGRVEIQGLDLVKNLAAIRKIIGVVPQEYALYPKLTARENLQFFGSLYGVSKGMLRQQIEEGLDKMGLSKYANRKIETFSGGMKRRINLLAGLLHRPQVLFLDEPTVGVDVQSKSLIMSFLKELSQEKMTLIYSSHILHEAQEFCTKVAVLDEGRIKLMGKTEEVLVSNGKTKTLEEIFLEYTQQNV